MSDIMKTIFGEGVERFVRKGVGKADLSAIGNSEGGRGIALKILTLLDDFVPPAAYPIVGSVVGAFLAKPGLIDRLLPDDSVAGVKEAKIILQTLQTVIPSGIIGGSETFAGFVKRSVDGVRSENGTPDNQQFKLLDWVVMSRRFPGRIFILARDDDGNVRFDEDGVPIVLHRDWRMMLESWNENHKASTKMVFAGKGKQKKEEKVPRELFPFVIVRLKDAVHQVDGRDISQGDVESLKRLLVKKDWYDYLNPNTRKLMRGVSAYIATLSPFNQKIAEDLWKDLKNSASPSEMNDLGDSFESRVPDQGPVTKDVYKELTAHIDVFMGAELEKTMEIKIWAKRAYSAYKNGSLPVGSAVKYFLMGIGILSPVGILLIGALLSFLTSAYLFIWAASADVTQPFNGMADGQSAASSAALVSAWTIMILLTFLSVIELVFGLFTKVLKLQKGWLTDVGKKIGALIGCYGGLAIMMLHYGISTHWRFFLPLTAMMAMGTAYTISLGENTEGENGRLARQAGKVFKWIVTALFIYMILGSAWEVIGVEATEWAKKGFEFIKSHKVLSFVILTTIALAIGGLALRWFETSDSFENGEWSRVRTPSLAARLVVFAMIVVLAGWSFVEEPNQRYQWFHTPTADEIAKAEKEAAAKAKAAAARVQHKPRVKKKAQVAGKVRSPRKHRRPRRDRRVEFDCSGDHTFDMKRSFGCF
jgi:cytochrome b561